jgi:hypothetical protein
MESDLPPRAAPVVELSAASLHLSLVSAVKELSDRPLGDAYATTYTNMAQAPFAQFATHDIL